jgi:hypothetical protein
MVEVSRFRYGALFSDFAHVQSENRGPPATRRSGVVSLPRRRFQDGNLNERAANSLGRT